MQITKSSTLVIRLGLALGIVITVSACGTVAVDPVKSNHPASAAALSAPEVQASDILNVKAVERTEAPVMDHSMHDM